MFQRLMGYIKALFGVKLDQWEDPEILLAQAQQEMKQVHAQNRERAVQAISQKNRLEAELHNAERTVANLQAKAELALKNGDRDLARQLLVEKGQYEGTLAVLQQSYASAVEMTSQVKETLRHEESRVRARAAQALAMKAQWKQAQIETSINKALDGMTVAGGDTAFARAQSKIDNARSESSARSELSKGRLDTKLASLDNALTDAQADKDLAALEQRMGIAPATNVVEHVTTISAEEEINRLIGGA